MKLWRLALAAALMVSVSLPNDTARAGDNSSAANSTIPHECNISSSPSDLSLTACSATNGGAIVDNTDANHSGNNTGFKGLRSDPGNANGAVDVWTFCRYLNNTLSESVFVPINSSNEWTQFIKNSPYPLVNCSRPQTGLPVYPSSYGPIKANPPISPSVKTPIAASPVKIITVDEPNYYQCKPSTTPGDTGCVATATVSIPTWSPTANYTYTPPAPGAGWTETATATYTGQNSDSGTNWILTNMTYTTTTGAQCGSSNGQALTSPPTDLCKYGAFIDIDTTSSTGPWSWQCDVYQGSNAVANCAATKAAVCGSANGAKLSSAPTTSSQLCSVGQYNKDISSSPPWSWSCSNQGNTKQCAAAQGPIDATCGPSATTQTSQPTSGFCDPSTGTYNNDISGSGPWSWSCKGIAGGNPAPCVATTPVPTSCPVGQQYEWVKQGFDAGNTKSNPPTASLTDDPCAPGSIIVTAGAAPNNIQGTTLYVCGCAASNCGAAQGVATVSAPASNLCTNGYSATVSSSNGNWIWKCSQGVRDQCNAPIAPCNNVMGISITEGFSHKISCGMYDNNGNFTGSCSATSCSSAGYANYTNGDNGDKPPITFSNGIYMQTAINSAPAGQGACLEFIDSLPSGNPNSDLYTINYYSGATCPPVAAPPSCGTASGTTASSLGPWNDTPTTVCSSGSLIIPSSENHSNGNWVWNCSVDGTTGTATSSQCSAPITTPTFYAGCGLYGLLGNSRYGEAANQSVDQNCGPTARGSNGQTNGDWRINFSVGNQLTSLPSSVGAGNFEWYGLSFPLSTQTGRFNYQLSGDLLNQSGVLPNNTIFNPDGTVVSGGNSFVAPTSKSGRIYNQSITVKDNWGGSSQTFNLTADQEETNCNSAYGCVSK